MTLGEKLVKLRKENNYTQEELAEVLGVSRQAISKWEADAAFPETETLIRLGELYDCSMDYLLKDKIEASEKPTAEKTENALFCKYCGKSLTENALFCMYCGKSLAANTVSQTQATASREAASVTVESTEHKEAEAPKTRTTKEKAFTLARLIMLPCLLAAMFLSSFFGMFKTYVPFYGIEAEVTGFDAVRGMFLLISPPEIEDLQRDFAKYADENYDLNLKSESTWKPAQKTELKKAIESYGAISLCIYTGGVSTSLYAQVILYGIYILLLMLLSLIFLILSVCHIVKLLIQRDLKVWRGETIALSLPTAFAFAVLIICGSLASASWAIVFLGLLGLAFVLFAKFYAHKEQKPANIVVVRRGVCAALVVLTAFFVSSTATNIHLNNITAHLHPNDLYDSMDVEPNKASTVNNSMFNELINDKESTKNDKEDALMIVGNPAVVFSLATLAEYYGPPAKAVAWILYAFRLLFAATLIMLLFGELLGASDPKQKSKWLTVPYIMLFVSSSGVFGGTLPFPLLANGAAYDCGLKLQYSIGILQIAALVLCGITLITYGIFKAFENRKT